MKCNKEMVDAKVCDITWAWVGWRTVKMIFMFGVLIMVAGCRCAPEGHAKNAVRYSDKLLSLHGSPYTSEPKCAKLLNEHGDIAMFSGETEADIVFNSDVKRKDDGCFRNSLFLKRNKVDGSVEWRLLLTSGGDWKDAEGMDKWSKMQAGDIRSCYKVVKASLSKDRRYVWMVCDPSCTFWFDVVCRFDLQENTLAVLTDGDSAIEQSDGTIMVTGKKMYLSDENGEPLGARWYDLWMTPDGEVVRKGRLLSADELATEARDNTNQP